MRVTNRQLFSTACQMMSRMMQPTESPAHTDYELVQRAIKVAKMIAEQLPDEESVPSDTDVRNVVSACVMVANGRAISRTQLINTIRLKGYDQIEADYMVSRAEVLGIVVANVKGSRIDYTPA